jgi:DNA-binding PadR family transcriptional regulator
MPEASTNTPEIAPELTAFQQNILTILAEKPRYGLAVKRELQSYYDEEVNHGRLYPNLDELIELGLLEKSELDKRTNEYALTDDGHQVLLNQLDWMTSRYVSDEEREAELRSLLEAQS